LSLEVLIWVFGWHIVNVDEKALFLLVVFIGQRVVDIVGAWRDALDAFE
jgi:hypothetical protein